MVYAKAPCRINDIGGWTDTRFAKHGAVCSIAVWPGAEVCIDRRESGGVFVTLENYGETYYHKDTMFAQRHPFIHEAIKRGVSADSNMVITIKSDMPPGASTGTSAAVLVALIGALAYVAGNEYTPMEIAHMAHRVETDLGYESGIQDQAAAAFGGINLYRIDYPEFTVSPVDMAPFTRAVLERRLMLVYLGKPHASSEIHKRVIKRVSDGGFRWRDSLESYAKSAAVMIEHGDLFTYGFLMTRNTARQAVMDSGLVSADAEALIYRTRDQAGHKVNGAGGDGGTVTILTNGNPGDREAVTKALGGVYKIIPIQIADEGLRVWES